MTRDQIIEKVARAMCKERCELCYGEPCVTAAEGRPSDCMYTGYMRVARIAVAAMESIGYHFDGIGNMVAPPVEGYAAALRLLLRLTIKLLAIIDDARARGLELDTIVEFHETLTRMSFEVEVPVSVHPRRKPLAPPA
jgi:hypothetical protein